MSHRRWILSAFTIVFASTTPQSTRGQSTHGASGSPIEPRRAALGVRLGRCSYGGAAPAFFVDFEVDAGVALTGVSVAGFGLQSTRGTWIPSNQGPISLREFRGMTPAGAFDVAAFNGQIAAGTTRRLQAFGALSMTAFGAAATYPDVGLRFALQVQASGGAIAMVRGSACTVLPAG